MKFNLLLTALAVLLLTAVQAKNSTEITGFENPESIIAYKDHLFVSNTGAPLPQVSHPLITAYAAAEARGIFELSRVGPIGRVSIELPLFGPSTAPGLVLPGMLPRLSGELMTRSLGVNIAAATAENGLLTVRQSLELERHYDA